jgi:hypothetical protein
MPQIRARRNQIFCYKHPVEYIQLRNQPRSAAINRGQIIYRQPRRQPLMRILNQRRAWIPNQGKLVALGFQQVRHGGILHRYRQTYIRQGLFEIIVTLYI